jgi:hypothetical protein
MTIPSEYTEVYTDNTGQITTCKTFYADELLKEGDVIINDMVTDSIFFSKISTQKGTRKNVYVLKEVYEKQPKLGYYEVTDRKLLLKKSVKKYKPIKFQQLPATTFTYTGNGKEYTNVLFKFIYGNETGLVIRDGNKLAIKVLKEVNGKPLETFDFTNGYADCTGMTYFENEHFLVLKLNDSLEFIYGMDAD